MFIEKNIFWKNKLEIKKRKKIKKNEIYKIFLLKLSKNLQINKLTRFKILCYLNKKFKQNSIIKIKNKCIFTGRSRGLINDFKISRIKFKEFTLKGLIPNVSKLSW